MAIEKKKLLKLLAEALELEENAIPIYNRHLKTALFWSGLPAADREQLRIQLGILDKESTRHCRILSELTARIKEDARDVF